MQGAREIDERRRTQAVRWREKLVHELHDAITTAQRAFKKGRAMKQCRSTALKIKSIDLSLISDSLRSSNLDRKSAVKCLNALRSALCYLTG